MHELLPLLMQAGYFGIAYGPEPRREPEPKLVLPLKNTPAPQQYVTTPSINLSQIKSQVF